MHHTGYQPDTVALISAGNAIDSALQKGLQRVGFRVQLLGPEQASQLRAGALVINATSCGGSARQAQARSVCESLSQLSYTALLHLSSYAVFGGGVRKKIHEDDDPGPDTDSGREWLYCEQQLSALDNASILRLGWKVDRSERALLGRIVSGLLQKKPVVLDEVTRGNPVTVSDLVRVVVAVTQQLASGAPRSGIYHYGSADTCTAMDFGREVVDRVQSLYGEDFAAELLALSPAAEDHSSVLACEKLRDVFGIQQRSWRQGLTRQVELWLERLQKVES